MAHDRDFLSQQHSFINVMRDVHDRHAVLLPNSQQLLLHDPLADGIDVCKRLVHQQYGRLLNQGTRELTALLHSTRKLVREFVGMLLQPNQVECCIARLAAPAVETLDCQPKFNILMRSQPGKQGT